MANNNNRNKKMGVPAKAGLGLAALAATAAGIYYFYGSKEGAKRRKALKGWAVKAQGEIMQRIEKLQNVNRETYNQIVDQVISRYRGMKGVSVGELVSLGKELKGHWNNIMKDVGTAPKAAGSRTGGARARRGRSKKQQA